MSKHRNIQKKIGKYSSITPLDMFTEDVCENNFDSETNIESENELTSRKNYNNEKTITDIKKEQRDIPKCSQNLEQIDSPERSIKCEQIDNTDPPMKLEEIDSPESSIKLEQTDSLRLSMKLEDINSPESIVKFEHLDSPRASMTLEEINSSDSSANLEHIDRPKSTMKLEEINSPEYTTKSEQIDNSESLKPEQIYSPEPSRKLEQVDSLECLRKFEQVDCTKGSVKTEQIDSSVCFATKEHINIQNNINSINKFQNTEKEMKKNPNLPEKTDGKTIEIVMTKELRLKEKPSIPRPNKSNIEIDLSKVETKSQLIPSLLSPRVPVNIQTAAINYQQSQGYVNPIQNNQQYYNVPQYNQLSANPGLPSFNYPTGIPRSFYLNNRGEFLANPMTLNLQDVQNAPQPIPEVPRTVQNPFMYTDNISCIDNTMLRENQEQLSSIKQAYSSSQVFSNTSPIDEDYLDGSNTPDYSEPGEKRLSAFQRLGPVPKAKKPKLTINLVVNEEQCIREVVNENDGIKNNKHTPVYLREDILTSTDPTVLKYIKSWPWKNKVRIIKTVTARSSKTVMLLELEQMDEYYEKQYSFTQISITGYPSSWNKEHVLDAVLESVKEHFMIPCFIEFSEEECKFIVFKSRQALMKIHRYGFIIHENGVELNISISCPDLENMKIDLVPSTVLRQRLSMCYDGESKLNLKEFTTKNDISHFIYFPLNRISNQTELVNIQYVVIWGFLVELDLSYNRITSIEGFSLAQTMPKLKHLNLSHNLIERMTVLLNIRQLSLKSICLEGNPMCTDYTDPQDYVKVITMLFQTVIEIDGIPLNKGKLPPSKNNYCPEEARAVVEKFLDVFFTLWDGPLKQRSVIRNLYENDANFTGCFTSKLRYGKLYRDCPKLFLRTQTVYKIECESETVTNVKWIWKVIKRWPETEHDPHTFLVDVLFHNEKTTIIKIEGIMKLTANTLADEEHLLAFTRTVILRSEDGFEYKIHREWVLWDEPREEKAKTAFQITMVKPKEISLEINAPNNEIKEKLIEIFMQITTMEKKPSQRCLEMKNWHLKHALEYFSKLLKLDDIECLLKN